MSRDFYLAGAGGIGPTLTVLETVVLPLYDAPTVNTFAENMQRIFSEKKILPAYSVQSKPY